MITVSEIKDFARKVWNRGDVLRSAVTGNLRSLSVYALKTGGQHAVDSFAEIQKWVSDLNAASKESVGFGFTVEFAEINHRKLGRQNLPSDIRFDTPVDLARFIGKLKDLESFRVALEVTKERNPEVALWMVENPMKAVPYFSVWGKILDVCAFVQENPRPGIYLRQLTLQGSILSF